MDINNKNDLAELTESVRKYTMAAVNENRYKHSVRVANTCAMLCKRYGLNERLGFFAGIAHDMCKNMDNQMLLRIASRDGQKITRLEKEKPALLHGRAAAVKLQEDWNFTESDVLEAIANHTFGKKGMCDLAKLLYVADKIEPGREQVTEEYTARLLAMDIDGITAAVIKESMDYLKGKGKTVSAATKAIYKSLKKEKKEEENAPKA